MVKKQIKNLSTNNTLNQKQTNKVAGGMYATAPWMTCHSHECATYYC